MAELGLTRASDFPLDDRAGERPPFDDPIGDEDLLDVLEEDMGEEEFFDTAEPLP